MPLEIRPITTGEWDSYVELDAYSFAYEATDEVRTAYPLVFRPEWTLAAFEDGRMVAHLVAAPWSIMLNGAVLPMGAVADVAVWPEDRRSGHAAALLRACLGSMRDQGLVVSMLYPTFYTLYQRFGWAQAAEERVCTMRTSELRLLDAGTRPAGRAERRDNDALPELMTVYDAALREANCTLTRDEGHWRRRQLGQTGRAKRQVILWRGAGGDVEGYLLHALPSRPNWQQGTYDQDVAAHELMALTPAAYRGLVEYLLRHDLATQTAWSAPPDDPLPSLLANPKLVKVEQRPGFMLRIVDLVPALERRGYLPGPPARLSLRLHDATAPWNDGTWLLTVEQGKARAVPTTTEPNLTLDIRTLAALYNGFLSPARAIQAGLLQAGDPAAIETAARVFAVTRPPYCLDYF
jgi:predicted acetyltransferase